MTRRIRYQVAASLDGYIAGPKGEFDWIPHDPDFDFAALHAQFDTYLMGRATYELVKRMGDSSGVAGRVIVFTRTLRAEDNPGVEIVADGIAARLDELRAQPGKDIWLFGGGELFRALLALDQVDSVEIAVMPVLLGGGIPMLPAPAVRRKLTLRGHQVSKKTGTTLLQYDVVRDRSSIDA